jgi:hypothetical protein
MTYQSLLPAASTAWERAVEEASATFEILPVPIADLWNPDKCPEHMLPWLAVTHSVDLWRPGWPVWKKRQVIREAIQLARLKGTQAALERYLAQVDAELVNIVTPPVKMFLGKSMSKEELDQFYAVMPQLRLYPYRNRNNHVFGKMFLGRGLGPGRFLLPSVAYTGRRAYLYDPLTGEETLLTTIQLEAKSETRAAIEQTRVVNPGDPGNAFFLGGSKGFLGRHLGVVNKRSVVYTIETRNDYLHVDSKLRLSTISPSLKPLDVRFERGGETWFGPGGKFYLGRGLGKYLVPSEAWRHAFAVVRLHDPIRTPMFHRGARWFLGNRLGVAPHTAHIRVRLKQQHRKHTFFLGRHLDRVYLRPIDTTRRDAALEAVHVAKAAHEKILVSFQLYRERRFGDAVLMGSRSRFSTLIPREP